MLVPIPTFEELTEKSQEVEDASLLSLGVWDFITKLIIRGTDTLSTKTQGQLLPSGKMSGEVIPDLRWLVGLPAGHRGRARVPNSIQVGLLQWLAQGSGLLRRWRPCPPSWAPAVPCCSEPPLALVLLLAGSSMLLQSQSPRGEAWFSLWMVQISAAYSLWTDKNVNYWLCVCPLRTS